MSLPRVPDPIEALLSFLDPDPQRAGVQYAALQLRLAKFFEWREATSPLDLADRTLDRVGEKIAAGARIKNLNSYCRRVAYFIYLEWLNRQPEYRSVPFEEAVRLIPAPPAPEVSESETQGRGCQQKCLLELPGGTRELLREYFTGAARAGRAAARASLCRDGSPARVPVCRASAGIRRGRDRHGGGVKDLADDAQPVFQFHRDLWHRRSVSRRKSAVTDDY